jgi:prenyltransferase beta subunit
LAGIRALFSAIKKQTIFHFFSCQTYEGGLSGYPGLEAHGGYTYCGVAALVLLQRTDAIDLERLSVRLDFVLNFRFNVFFFSALVGSKTNER